MTQTELFEETRFNEDLFRLVSYALVMLMMVCAALTLSQLIHYFFTDWKPALIAWLAFFVAFERLYTYPRFKRLSSFSSEWFTSLLAQWIVMLLVIRIALGLSHGLPALQVELQSLTLDFAGYFFSPEFTVALVIAVLVWMFTGSMADLLDEMGYERALILREIIAMDSNYVPPRARLMSMILSLGSALIIFTALVRVNVRELFAAVSMPSPIRLGALDGGGGSTLLYFMLGLALLSQAHFISLHTSWRLHETRVSRGLVQTWGPYSLTFLLLLAAVISLLPTHYSLGLLSALGYALDVTIQLLYFLSQFVLSLLLFLIGLPFMLMGGDPPQTELPPPPVLPEPPALGTPDGGAFPWWALIRSIVSWALLLGIVGFSLMTFVRQHGELVGKLRGIPGGRWLLKLLDWLIAFFGGVRSGVQAAVQAGLARLRARGGDEESAPLWSFLNLRRLDPRQRVYYFYLALVRRGSEHGLVRSPSQTPYEYASTLEPALPDVDAEIDDLTDSFIQARYSRHAVPPEQASRVKATWERIRRALRGVHKP